MVEGSWIFTQDFLFMEKAGKEYTQIKALKQEAELVEGRNYYLLCSQWWRLWKQYTQFPILMYLPGEIDNGPLVSSCGGVKRSLRQKEDYVLLSEDVWDELYSK
jgi:hypothetical protein